MKAIYTDGSSHGSQIGSSGVCFRSLPDRVILTSFVRSLGSNGSSLWSEPGCNFPLFSIHVSRLLIYYQNVASYTRYKATRRWHHTSPMRTRRPLDYRNSSFLREVSSDVFCSPRTAKVDFCSTEHVSPGYSDSLGLPAHRYYVSRMNALDLALTGIATVSGLMQQPTRCIGPRFGWMAYLAHS